jgi:predicted HAD superfamily Cof-like phosphohydrolase
MLIDYDATNADMVYEFHEVFGLPTNGDVDNEPKLIELRLKLIQEEWDEVKRAFASETKYDIAKELCDLLYVTYGALISFGMDPDMCFREVHRSNMSKLDDNGLPIYNEYGKVIKGPNYSQADMKMVLGAK